MSLFDTTHQVTPPVHSLFRNANGEVMIVIDRTPLEIEAPTLFVDPVNARVFLKPNDDATIQLEEFANGALDGLDQIEEVHVAEMEGTAVVRMYAALVSVIGRA